MCLGRWLGVSRVFLRMIRTTFFVRLLLALLLLRRCLLSRFFFQLRYRVANYVQTLLKRLQGVDGTQNPHRSQSGPILRYGSLPFCLPVPARQTGVGNNPVTTNDRTFFSRPLAALTQDAKIAKSCLLFFFYPPFQSFPWRSLRLCERMLFFFLLT